MHISVFKESGFVLLLLFTGLLICGQSLKPEKYEVAVYYFPNYHVDSINEKWHGRGWSEWELVKAAKPRFRGHQQPKVPAWGYFNEADPRWAGKEIELAAGHGIDVFIYDWYWYENTGMYLQEGLEKGFLRAPGNSRMKFALMWANHNWANIHPTPYTNFQQKLTDGKVSFETWDKITDYIIKNYFKRPNYWKIDGRPYFSIFEAVNFISGFKTLEKAAEAMNFFEEKVKKAGFPGLHLNCIDQGITGNSLRNALQSSVSTLEALRALHAASVTSYNFLYAYDLSKAGWPTANYREAVDANTAYWKSFSKEMQDITYFPNVTMGWDVTPRLVQTDRFDTFKGYPWTPVFNGDNTPQAFRSALIRAKNFLDTYDHQPKIVILNAWNEWTEGSYLLPDAKTGTKYLDAVKAVFGK